MIKFLAVMGWGWVAFVPSSSPAQGPVAAPLSTWTMITEKAAGAPDTGYNIYKAALRQRGLLLAYYKKYAGWKAPAAGSPGVAGPSPATGPSQGEYLAALGDKPRQPRFPLTDKVWPARPGETSICLWEDDKVAAVSVSIDDNNAQDIPAWKEISRRYGGLALTWFLISDNIDGTVDPAHARSSGSWSLWRDMLKEEYHLGSHSVTHVGDPVWEDGWPGPDWEAAESIRQLDSGLAGHRTRVFAYPGSALPDFNMSLNWRASAARYYIAARGTSGIPINKANMTDYFDIRTTSGPADLITDDPARAARPFLAEANYHNILEASDPLSPYHAYYRGWATVFVHDLGPTGADLSASPNRQTASLAKVFAFFSQNRDRLWIGALEEVASYGEERDMATVRTLVAGAGTIRFGLVSRMDPERFDYPLTIKVRLPMGWGRVRATQARQVLQTELVQHEGAVFALVKAFPNKGDVNLQEGL